MRNAFLIGNRVYLRPLDERDIDFCVEHLNSPAVTRYVGVSGPLNRIREREWIEKLYKDASNLVLGICDCETDALMGVCGLHEGDTRDRHAEIGIWIAESHWNQGYGRSALRMLVDYGFQERNLRRIFLRVMGFNKRAIAVYEKLNFQLEGTLREHVYREGKYHDLHMMGLLRSEWESRKG